MSGSITGPTDEPNDNMGDERSDRRRSGRETSLLRARDQLIIARSELVLLIHKLPVNTLIRPFSHALLRLSDRPSFDLIVTGLVHRTRYPPADYPNYPKWWEPVPKLYNCFERILNIRNGRKRVLQACFADREILCLRIRRFAHPSVHSRTPPSMWSSVFPSLLGSSCRRAHR